MDYQPKERVQIKLECLRMVTRLRLNPARMQLIIGFFESYLVLSDEEEKALHQKISKELKTGGGAKGDGNNHVLA